MIYDDDDDVANTDDAENRTESLGALVNAIFLASVPVRCR